MRIILFIISLMFFPGTYVFGQIGNTIPSNRITDWERSGYMRSPTDNLPSSADTVIQVASPTGNSTIDYNNILSALDEAKNHPLSDGDTFVEVRLQSDIYRVNKIISLGPEYNNIIIRGQGVGDTKIVRETGGSSSTTLRTLGIVSSAEYNVNSYDSNSNSITLGTSTLQSGDFIEIRIPNGSWANSANAPDSLLGQIIKIKYKFNYNVYELDDDFSYLWSLAQSENKTPSVRKVETVNKVGIEELTINNESNDDGFLVHISKSSNVWVKDISSFYAVGVHLNVSQSTQIEIKDNFFHHAKFYGGGGNGYGVHLGTRTTNALVENNRFQSLRHSMIISKSSNRNVFGYNYSMNQRDTNGNILGDISIHGNFPFFNLFEGNRIERIEADNYWGDNGPYNTFFRNFTTQGITTLEPGNDLFNIIGNDSKLYLEGGSSNTLQKYDENLNRLQTSWKFGYRNNGILSDISYYHNSKPSFLQGYSWPPIGPKTSSTSSVSQNELPSRTNFCNENAFMCEERKEDLAVYRANGSENPTDYNRLVAFKSEGSTFDYLTEFTSNSYSYVEITTGDFNGDGVDDIAYFRRNSDSDFTKNRIELRYSSHDGFDNSISTSGTYGNLDFHDISSGDVDGDGRDELLLLTEDSSGKKNKFVALEARSGFPKKFEGQYGGYDIYGITSGDFNDDGLDDIAFFRSYGDGDPNLINRIAAFKSQNGTSFSYMREFTYSNKDIKGITSGDYNGDGIDDIAIFREGSIGVDNRVYIFRSNGSNFYLLTNFIHTSPYGSFDIKGLASGDFNNDRFEDIAFFRRNSYSNSTKNRVMVWKSGGSTFSYLTTFTYGGYDFKGITSGYFGDSHLGKRISNSKDIEIPQVEKDFITIKNYPNPFNPSTNIVIYLRQKSSLNLEVYNMMGQKISTVFNGYKNSGVHEFRFDGSNLASGIYFMRATHDKGTVNSTITLMK